ncbi:42886_t:CDS:2, partial [Gigaspora margarita]
MTGWKYSFERLSKHKYIACIIHPKKVVCICGKTIKLNRKWEEDYLNRHVQRSECKANEGQRTIYNWFQPVEQKEHYGEEEYNEKIEYDSDVYDNMDNDDLIQIDEIDKDLNQEFQAISIDKLNYIQSNKKWLICVGLQSVEISKYIKQTPVQFGGCHRIEIVACELFSYLFAQKFKNSWIIFADKALKGAFNDAPIFTGLCEVISDAIERKMKNKSNKNLKYSEEFTNFLVILGGISSRALDIFRQNLENRSIQILRRNNNEYLTNSELCYENVAKFKKLIDTINYNGPIAAMTDNTKLKLGLRYSSNLGCIIESVLSNEETKINIYSDISRIINKIKTEDRIAKSVPLPAFPPIVIALIPNNG